MHRTSARTLIWVGMLVITVGVLGQAVLKTGSSWWVVLPGLAVVGIGAGMVMPPLSSAAMSAAPWQRAGMAGGALSTFRQLGFAFGIAILGEVFRGGLTRTAGGGLAGALSGGQAQAVLGRTPALTPVVHHAFASALDVTYLVAAGLGLLGGVLALVFVRPAAARPAPQPAASEPAPASVEA
jgi:hypothetical protein